MFVIDDSILKSTDVKWPSVAWCSYQFKHISWFGNYWGGTNTWI